MFLFLRGCQSLDIQNDPTIKIALCPNVDPGKLVLHLLLEKNNVAIHVDDYE
jgi:hypothetical protein